MPDFVSGYTRPSQHGPVTAVGTPAEGETLVYSGGQWVPQEPATGTGTLGPIYGGGADGAIDLDGVNEYSGLFTRSGSQYTQTANVRATTFVVQSGVTLLPSQYWIYAETSFVNDGTIRANGNAANAGTAGAGISAAGVLSTASGAGAAGRTTTGIGATAAAANFVVGGFGGAGGAGGASAGGGGSGAVPPATYMAVGSSFFRSTHRLLQSATVSGATSAGGGGAGGAVLNTGTATTGAGGSGASSMRFNARSFQNNGTITCTGGAGGNAATTLDATAGGGAGGGGGYICVQCDALVDGSGTITCAGGAGGTGSGTASVNGATGPVGRVEIITPTGTTNS